MPTKVLVLGSTGMLGHQVVNYLSSLKDKYTVIDISYRNKLNDNTIIIDIEKDLKKLEKIIKNFKPKFIVNCIGILVSESLNNLTKANYINGRFPHHIKEICKKNETKLIHISTDCVFSGSIGNYKEDDVPDSKTNYGKSKILGEIIDRNNLTLRTSIIGPEIKQNGEGLLSWFLNEPSKELNGYSRAFWSGVTTIELSKIIEKCFKCEINGLYHITNNKKISKFHLLKLFNNHLCLPKKILEDTNIVNDKSLIDTRKKLKYTIPSYEEMINEMFQSMVGEEKYNHYKNKISSY